jgi:tetratricopeptide (TPR) repeat protein
MSPFDIDQMANSGSLREALNLALTEIRSGSRQGDLFFLAARIAFELGDLAKSEQLVKHLLALDPEHLNGWILFGKVYRQKGDLTRSNYGIRRAQEIFPALEEYNLIADLKSSEVRTNVKIPSLSNSQEIFETETYADICVRQGYLNKALKIYSDLKEKYPDNAGLESKIGDVKRKLGGHD